MRASNAAFCNINQPTETEAVRQVDTVPEGVSIQPDYPEDSCVPCANRSTLTTQKQSSSTSYQQNKSSNHKRTLKDLQTVYFEKQIDLTEAQMECYNKISKLADVLIKKLK